MVNTSDLAKIYTTVPARPGQRAMTRITCGKCGAFDDIRGGIKDGSDGYMRIFTNRGWHVGNSTSRHRCPACMKPQRAIRNEPPVLVVDNTPTTQEPVPVAKPPAPPDPVPPVPNASAMPPREITREDRRLIIAKIEEVYLDEKSGYSAGWHDERVATDMKVPRAWVEMLRDENFGPQFAVENPQIKELADEIAKLKSRQEANLEKTKITSRLCGEVERMLQDQRNEAIAIGEAIDKVRVQLRALTGRS